MFSLNITRKFYICNGGKFNLFEGRSEDADINVDEGDSDLIVRIVRLTDSTIHLDWVPYSEPEGLLYYKVTWSSVAQPSVSVIPRKGDMS